MTVNVTRLLSEAASKSGVMWVSTPGGTRAVWFVWDQSDDPQGQCGTAYVISGPGEQTLPTLPDTVDLILRSKDSGGRLLRISAAASAIESSSEQWDHAAELLKGGRLNATDEVISRWRDSATIYALTPHGRPEEFPGSYAADPGRAPIAPAAGATARWKPWHWGGRGAAGERRAMD